MLIAGLTGPTSTLGLGVSGCDGVSDRACRTDRFWVRDVVAVSAGGSADGQGREPARADEAVQFAEVVAGGEQQPFTSGTLEAPQQ